MMNNIPKHVVSTTLKQPAWNNTTVIRNNVPEEVRRLQALSGMDILVAGSGRLVQTLMQNDLVDEYRLMIFPIILGKGMRLFKDGYDSLPLRVVEARTVGAGVQTLILHPDRKR
jgi:dihydrofolate reductase